ncbi:MAG: hypothetical protein WCV92_00190 [Candidatus Buchananbacteria bacterium]
MSAERVEAQDNFVSLCESPSNGIVVAFFREVLYQVAWIMGDSNCTFAIDDCDGSVRVVPINPGIPCPVSYLAMAGYYHTHVVTNGQTESVIDHLRAAYYAKLQGGTPIDATFVDAAFGEADSNQRRFGLVDAPRVSAYCFFNGEAPHAGISVTTETDDGHRRKEQYPNMESGFGYCVTTSTKDTGQTHSFRGPLLVPVIGDHREIAETYWNILPAGPKILVIKRVDPKGHALIQIMDRQSA